MLAAMVRAPGAVSVPFLPQTHGNHPTPIGCSPEGRSPSAGCLAPAGRLPPPLGALRLPCGTDVPSAPRLAAWLSLRTTVRRGCSAARPPGGRRGVPVTKRRNLRGAGGGQAGCGQAQSLGLPRIIFLKFRRGPGRSLGLAP